MPDSALPNHLKGKLHDDWFFPFCYIPRAWTSYKLFQPPKVLIGSGTYIYTNGGVDPCQRKAWAWYLSIPLYFTITFGKTGWYMRIGCRWDSQDRYYTIPSFALKKIEKWNI